MAEARRMTAAREAVEEIMRSEHADVLRESVAFMVRELMEAEVCAQVGAELGVAVQAGDHRHADGEQPDGAVVAAVDHGARPVPRPEAVRRAVRATDRARRRRRAAGAPAPADQAAGQAPHEGARRRRPAGQAGADARRSTCTRATASSTTRTCSASARRSSGCSATSTATASRSCARSRCCASSACIRASSTTAHDSGPVRQARRAGRAARRRRRRRPPRARLQPVHRLPRAGPRAPRPRGHRLLLPRRPHAPARPRPRAVQGRHDPVFLISLKAGGLRAQPDRGRLLLPARPVVEPGDRGPGDRPHPPHRPDPPRDVYRLIARDTIEEKVVALAQRKAALFTRRHGRRRPLRAAASPPRTSGDCSGKPPGPRASERRVARTRVTCPPDSSTGRTQRTAERRTT